MRIGIDVGGTHTDAVILEKGKIIAVTKSLTTNDVTTGIANVLDEVLNVGGVQASAIKLVMIGTTQFTNAIVERRELAPIAVVRIALPSGEGMPPMIDWPSDMKEAMDARIFNLHGGYLYDGFPVAQIRQSEIDQLIADLIENNIKNIAIASAFSPMNSAPEEVVGTAIRSAIPDAKITLSHNFGRLGLLERENATILNASLLPFAQRVVSAFQDALKIRNLYCEAYISQNDGTLMNAEFVRAFPALTFSSGPTNSLRGAARLTGLDNAIVVDIGGTTSDIGVLYNGFPRESNIVIDVGGVRTNFRMPDIMAIGLGGGSLVREEGSCVGPKSVGHDLVSQGMVFGGNVLTATDIVVAAGDAEIGDPTHVASLDMSIIKTAKAKIASLLDRGIEMMKPDTKDLPVILVGGGAVLVNGSLSASSKIYRPEHAGVANAIGAAIAQVGGEAERMLSYRSISREDAIRSVTEMARERAISAGADENNLKTMDIEETAIPYMDEGSTRIRVKVIGDLAV